TNDNVMIFMSLLVQRGQLRKPLPGKLQFIRSFLFIGHATKQAQFGYGPFTRINAFQVAGEPGNVVDIIPARLLRAVVTTPKKQVAGTAMRFLNRGARRAITLPTWIYSRSEKAGKRVGRSLDFRYGHCAVKEDFTGQGAPGIPVKRQPGACPRQ